MINLRQTCHAVHFGLFVSLDKEGVGIIHCFVIIAAAILPGSSNAVAATKAAVTRVLWMKNAIMNPTKTTKFSQHTQMCSSVVQSGQLNN